MRWQLGMRVALLASLTVSVDARAEGLENKGIKVIAVDREPKDGREKPSEAKLALLRKAVADNPDERTKRFDLVRGLMAGGDLQSALKEAQAWREKDAYNLVVVRLLGDIYSELGQKDQARRTYSAIVELVPKDLDAQRALATVLKQGGDLDAAYDRLVAATRLRPDDVRTGFELADVAQRLGRADEAAKRLEDIVQASATPEAVRYPAKQRLAQLYASKKREQISRGDSAAAKVSTDEIAKLGIKGGTVNDLKIYLTWDTDKTDVDLWVTNPSGEKIFYSHKEGTQGDALFDDVTSGYGPESYTARSAQPGTYLVQVNYFSSRRSAFNEARGEVVAILHEGTAQEERHVLPYRLFNDKQTVTVARIEVKQ
jgi:Flp pilus assembly protein TadD